MSPRGPIQQRGLRGTEKDTVSKPSKTPKTTAGDQPRDMRYYAQKLSGLADLADAAELEALVEGEDTVQEEVEMELAQAAITAQSEAHASEDNMEIDGEEETEQLTLVAILWAVNVLLQSTFYKIILVA